MTETKLMERIEALEKKVEKLELILEHKADGKHSHANYIPLSRRLDG